MVQLDSYLLYCPPPNIISLGGLRTSPSLSTIETNPNGMPSFIECWRICWMHEVLSYHPFWSVHSKHTYTFISSCILIIQVLTAIWVTESIMICYDDMDAFQTLRQRFPFSIAITPAHKLFRLIFSIGWDMTVEDC